MDGLAAPAPALAPVPISAAPLRPAAPLRDALRAATQEVHQRLHRHAGFAAIQAGTIGLPAYGDLIARLHGFHVPFEAAAGLVPERSVWLAEDLRALGRAGGCDAAQAAQIPGPDLPSLDSAARRLGALYVVEGAGLGGRELARSLDRLFGAGTQDGRRFFIGRGGGTGAAWQGCLARLAAAAPPADAAIIAAAVETFAAFEHWMTGWSIAAHD